MYSFLHGLLVQSCTSQLTDQCAHKGHGNSRQHSHKLRPTLLLKVLYPNVQTQPYQKSESELTNVGFIFGDFFRVEKILHETEGNSSMQQQLTQTTVIYKEQKLQRLKCPPVLYSNFPQGKVGSPRTCPSQLKVRGR